MTAMSTQPTVQGYDPDTGVGWPRPLMPHDYQRTRALPVPFVASVMAGRGGTYFDGSALDTQRADMVADDWLCQVCGVPAQDTAYAPINARNWAGRAAVPALSVSGGALCSPRCARLAIRVCPDFRGQGAIVSFTRQAAVWDTHGATLFTITEYEVVTEVAPARETNTAGQ
jgi:hypothetical protein